MSGKLQNLPGVKRLIASRTAASFSLRNDSMGAGSLRPAKYRVFHKMEDAELLPMLEDRLTALFGAGGVDEGTAEVFDDLIVAVAAEAFADLRSQRADGLDTNRRICVKKLADAKDVRRIRELRQQRANALEQALKKAIAQAEKYGEVVS